MLGVGMLGCWDVGMLGCWDPRSDPIDEDVLGSIRTKSSHQAKFKSKFWISFGKFLSVISSSMIHVIGIWYHKFRLL